MKDQKKEFWKVAVTSVAAVTVVGMVAVSVTWSVSNLLERQGSRKSSSIALLPDETGAPGDDKKETETFENTCYVTQAASGEYTPGNNYVYEGEAETLPNTVPVYRNDQKSVSGPASAGEVNAFPGITAGSDAASAGMAGEVEMDALAFFESADITGSITAVPESESSAEPAGIRETEEEPAQTPDAADPGGQGNMEEGTKVKEEENRDTEHVQSEDPGITAPGSEPSPVPENTPAENETSGEISGEEPENQEIPGADAETPEDVQGQSGNTESGDLPDAILPEESSGIIPEDQSLTPSSENASAAEVGSEAEAQDNKQDTVQETAVSDNPEPAASLPEEQEETPTTDAPAPSGDVSPEEDEENTTAHGDNHVYEEIIVEQPDCIHPGKAHYVCRVCGGYYEKLLPETGIHEWVLVSAESPRVYRCAVCGAEFTE